MSLVWTDCDDGNCSSCKVRQLRQVQVQARPISSSKQAPPVLQGLAKHTRLYLKTNHLTAHLPFSSAAIPRPVTLTPIFTMATSTVRLSSPQKTRHRAALSSSLVTSPTQNGKLVRCKRQRTRTGEHTFRIEVGRLRPHPWSSTSPRWRRRLDSRRGSPIRYEPPMAHDPRRTPEATLGEARQGQRN